MIATPTLENVTVSILAVCEKCKHYHNYEVGPDRVLHSMTEWESKHRPENDCRTHFITTKRNVPSGFDDSLYMKLGQAPWWLEKLGYKHNTDFKLAYVASSALTITLTGVTTSSTLLAGRESNTIDNSSSKYIDYFISGKVTVSSSAVTANTRIEVHSVTLQDDSTWPSAGTTGFTGTDNNATFVAQGVKDSIATPIVYLNVDATTAGRTYSFTYRSLAILYGGICPLKSNIFITQNTGQTLNSTGTNHAINTTGVYLTGT